MPKGQATPIVDGEEYFSYCWSAFLKPQFHTPYWTFAVMEQKSRVYYPIKYFRNIFILTVCLSLVIITLLSIQGIKKSLGPIKALMDGARHVASQQFNHHVTVKSKDEFHDLAVAFNSMTDQISQQFKALESRGDLDRAILSVLDMGQIISISLSHLELFFSAPHRIGMRHRQR